jgi:glycosyltransferase involved in cell wall biosynthesis
MSAVPAVTVVMPIHRTPARFFAEAIASVRAQSMPDWELLIVLDATTPECERIARQSATEAPGRIRVCGEAGDVPRGVSAARNLAIAQARGSLVAFLDADDVYEPDALRQRASLLEAHREAAMVYGLTLHWRSWTTGLGEDWLPDLGIPAGLHQPPELVSPLLTGKASVPRPCSVMARRDAVERAGGFDPAINGFYGEQVLYARLALRWPIVVHDRTLDRYRKHPESMTARLNPHDDGERERFLACLEAELDRSGIDSPGIRSAIAGERWKMRHPRLTTVRRLSGKAVKRLRRLWPQ